jgi:uncharacterized protein (TIGR02145 family)
MKRICFILVLITTIHGSCEKDINSNGDSGIFKDNRDDTEYNWIRFGDQIWMAENLIFVPDDGSYIINNDTSLVDIYGLLYDWETACEVCPDGWHLPSDDEWKELEIFLGMSKAGADSSGLRGTDEGNKLKSISGWMDDGNGTDENGFKALPGGAMAINGEMNNFGISGWWWTATPGGAQQGDDAWERVISWRDGHIRRYGSGGECGFSVRCIKDDQLLGNQDVLQ